MLNTLKNHAENLNSLLQLEGEEGQFEYLIEVGKKAPPLMEHDRIDKNKMSGCLAQVWIKHNKKGDRNYFLGDSDALIVKGLVIIISEALSGLISASESEMALSETEGNCCVSVFSEISGNF